MPHTVEEQIFLESSDQSGPHVCEFRILRFEDAGRLGKAQQSLDGSLYGVKESHCCARTILPDQFSNFVNIS
jgi:hypothetical protein